MNLPIPYPRVHQSLGMVARYKIETEYIALNLARIKFMMLTVEEAKKCKDNTLRTCSALSPIYVIGNHKMCVFKLFENKKEGIKKNCQVEVIINTSH